MRLPALLVAVALALAGCLAVPDPAPPPGRRDEAPAPAAEGGEEAEPEGEDAAPVEEAAPGAAPGPSLRVMVVNGTLTEVRAGVSAGVASLVFPAAGVAAEGTTGAFEGGDVTGIVVELAWTDPVYDLDLRLEGPDAEAVFPPESSGGGLTFSRGHAYHAYGGNTGMPDGPLRLVVDDPEALALAGDWRWSVTSKTANGVAFTVAVSLFAGATPPAGYTALG